MKHLNYRTYADLARDVMALAGQIPADTGGVLGVPRSGMVPAAMLATSLGLPLGMAFGSRDMVIGSTRCYRPSTGHGRILLVDDSIHTGASMAAAVGHLAELGIKREHLVTAAVYAEEADQADLHALILKTPRFFEWNVFGSNVTHLSLFDMDGVICADPTAFDDDGEDYRHNIADAIPLHVPRRPIQGIVTNRLERWRPETEAWLRKHGVDYGSLHMQPHATAAARRKTSNPAVFKAEHYDKSKARLFIESSAAQAVAIHKMTERPVLSIEGGHLFQ